MEKIKLRIYLFTLYIATLLFYFIAYRINIKNNYFYGNITVSNIIIFIFLAAFSESLIIVFKDLGIAPGFAATIAATMLFGTFWGMLILGLGVTLRYYKINSRVSHLFNTPIYKTLFNFSNYSISVFFSSLTLFWKSGSLYFEYPIEFFFHICVYVAVFLIINSFLVAVLFNILNGSVFLKTYLYHLRIGFLNIVFVTPFGILLYYLFIKFKLIGILMFILPTLVLKYIIQLYADNNH